jgi:dolichol kinase
METTQLTIKEAKEHAKKSYILLSNRWKHRRRMAYVALFSILAVTYLCLFKIDPQKIKALEVIVTWFYVTMGSIVGAYVGFATLDDKWKKGTQKEDE